MLNKKKVFGGAMKNREKMKWIILFCLTMVILFSQKPLLAEYWGFSMGSFGDMSTKIDGTEIKGDKDEIQLDIGLKIYGEIKQGLFFTLEMHCMADAQEWNNHHIFMYNYLVGPGIAYEPLSFIELASTLGFTWNSFAGNDRALDLKESTNRFGFGGNVSVALQTPELNGTVIAIGTRYGFASNFMGSKDTHNISGYTFFAQIKINPKLILGDR